MEILFYLAVFGGAALMVYNIIRYFLFLRTMRTIETYAKSKVLLIIPAFMLIAFLLGYIFVGIFGNKDLLVAGILFGGSVFVFLVILIIVSIVKRVRERLNQSKFRYAEVEREIDGLAHDAMAFFRVNLTKDKVLALGGNELYSTDLIGASFEEVLNPRRPNLISRLGNDGTHTFERKGLLQYYAEGHTTAYELLLIRNNEGKATFVSFKATMAEEPVTGDIIAFIIEESQNDKMIIDTILNRALSYRYDIVCSIVEGRYRLYASGQQENAKSILPEKKEGFYGDFCCNFVMPRLHEDVDKETMSSLLSLDNVREGLKDSRFYQIDVKLDYQGQTYYKQFTFYSVTEETQFFVLLVQDTTALHLEHQLQNEKLALALKEARTANAAKTTFFSNMSHDIRTPMNAITGFTAMALNNDDIDTVHDYLKKIDASADHLLSVINDVLEMSRIESGKIELNPKETDLNKLAKDTEDLFHVQMQEKHLEFKVETASLVHPHVMVDAPRLSRALLNLISNAYKFTPDGGKVEVTFEEKDCKREGNACYMISVRDTGIGMNEEFAKYVFDAYTREKKSTINEIQGTGLGMAITKSIVTLLGGEIEVKTKEGQGTEFIVRLSLPYVYPKAGGEEESGLSVEDIRFDGMRVLVADDNEINLEIAEFLLLDAGFEVEKAENGKEACDMVFSHDGNYYNIILMDVQMPVMDGLEATKRIRAHEDRIIASIPIVAFTADAFEEAIRLTKEAGMDAHLSKPVVPEQMRKIFFSLLSKQ